jgi:hypothetical protein
MSRGFSFKILKLGPLGPILAPFEILRLLHKMVFEKVK